MKSENVKAWPGLAVGELRAVNAMRRQFFDIYVPLCPVRYNKRIFGTIFLASLVYTWPKWQGWI